MALSSLQFELRASTVALRPKASSVKSSQVRGKICSVRGEEYQKGVGERALVLGADNFPFLGASALHGRVPWKGVFSCHELSGVWLF